MIAKKLQTATVTFSYRSGHDVLSILDQVRREINGGEVKISANINGLPYRINVKQDKPEESRARVGTINGKDCIIVSSKINQ